MLFHGLFCKDALNIDFDKHTALDEHPVNKRLSSRDNMSARNTVEVPVDVFWSMTEPRKGPVGKHKSKKPSASWMS